MSGMIWLGLVGIITSASVALYVAYEHRRSIRHIELFKRDPTVGVNPPMSPLLRWSAEGLWVLFTCSPSIAFLWLTLRSPGPVTREVLAAVAVTCVFLGITVSSFVSMFMARAMARLVGEVLTKGLLDATVRLLEARLTGRDPGPRST